MSVSKKYFDERIDDLKQLIEIIRRENAALKKNTDLKSALVVVKDQCLRTELYTKRKNLLIHGISNKENENIEETVNDFLSEMSIRNYRDIKFTAIYRLRSKAKRPIRQNSRPASDPILVSVLNLGHKDNIMASVSNLRKYGKKRQY